VSKLRERCISYESGLRECYILNPSFKQYGLGCSGTRGDK